LVSSSRIPHNAHPRSLLTSKPSRGRMPSISSLAPACFIFVRAQAMQLGVGIVGQVASADTDAGNEWLVGVSTRGDMKCSVEDECLVGSGEGSCKVMVNPSVPIELGSTDSGYHCDIAFNDSLKYNRATRFSRPKSDITITGYSKPSHWNLCWQHGVAGANRRAIATGVEDYCYYVNGLCYLWASPCSGGCSSLNAFSTYSSFCPTLRHATEAEWNVAELVLNQNRPAFYQKCAASQLDPRWNHCDQWNTFVRVEDRSYNELVLVCDGIIADI